MSAAIDFSVLEKIPLLLEKIESMDKEIKELKQELIPALDLTKRSGVKKYLGISESTLCNMMNDGRMKENIHYSRAINGEKTRISFIEVAILGLKRNKK
jgi:hypothetical protein